MTSLSTLRTAVKDHLDNVWSWLWPKQGEASRAWIVTGLVAGCGALLIVWLCREGHQLPPGPRGYPLIGAMAELSNDMHLDMIRLGKKYGDVISLKVGTSLMVVLNSHSAMKEAFVTSGGLFAARPKMQLMTECIDVHDELFDAEYDGDNGQWMKNRKFLMSSLRQFGFGNVGSEERMLDGINRLLHHLSEHSGQPISLSEQFPKVTLSVILHILFNKQYDFEDEKLKLYITKLRNFFNATSEDAVILMVIPVWMGRLFFQNVLKKLTDAAAALKTMIRQEVDEHVANYDPENILDFLDAYIQGRGLQNLDLEKATSTAFVLFPDAVETVAASMDWVLLHVTKFKAVQARAQDEIDRVIGRGRKVTWADHSRLTYVEAVVMETMRVVTPVVVTAPHCALSDTYFRGYFIPKEAQVMGNIYAIHRDPEVYEDPDVFRPERFLDSQGNLIKDDHWIPFGMGRRMCLGESFAKMEVFLMIANLLQQFDLSFPDGQPEVPMEPRMCGFARLPSPYKVVVAERG